MKTPFGLTERITLSNIVMQGGKWGPLQCSNAMDKIGKKCIDRGEHLYTYKKSVKICPLAMVDDLAMVSKCGYESVESNIYINTEIEMKKLRLHTPTGPDSKSKCHNLHVGKVKKCHQLKVHCHNMENVAYDTYLGDKITNDGRNDLTVQDRISK